MLPALAPRLPDASALPGAAAGAARAPGGAPCVLAPRGGGAAAAALAALEDAAGEVGVTLQRQRRHGDGVELEQATLAEALRAAQHKDCTYMLDEDILNEPYEVDGARRPQRIFQQVFALDEAAFGEDLLSTQMPPRVRPGLALVAAGLGARSSFHIDPFEWLGWNYCVSGAKVWTFFSCGGDEGVHAVPSLRFAEKAPVAWGGDQSEEALREVGLLSSDRLCLAVGYESEIDVYADLSEDVLVGLAEASDEDVAAAVGDCAVVREALGAGLRVEVCVQRPEELVVIPAGTAHMVVHGAGSVGVAGQHCNTANEERVGAHALRRCRGNVRVAAEGLEVAVEAAIIAANGKERGEAICDVLWQEWDAYTA